MSSYGVNGRGGGKHDTGIDLVAKDRITGDLVAIQCRFYCAADLRLEALNDSFLAAFGSQRLCGADHRLDHREDPPRKG